MDAREALEALSRTAYAGYWNDICEEVVDAEIDGVLSPVLMFTDSEFVGWVRFEGPLVTWRYGSLATRQASPSSASVAILEDDGLLLVGLVGDATRKIKISWPPEPTEPGEYIRFIERIEAGLVPNLWSSDPLWCESEEVVLDVASEQPSVSPQTLGLVDEAPWVLRTRTVYPAMAPAICASVALFFAVLDMPFGYYGFLRVLVTVAAIWVAIVAGQQKKTFWVVVFASIAVLFNPLFQVTATKAFWTIPDVLCLILFAVAGKGLAVERPEPERTYVKSM